MLCHAPHAHKCRLLFCTLIACFIPLAASGQVPLRLSNTSAKNAVPHLRLPVAHSKNMLAVTVTAVDADSVQATLADGTDVDADVKHGSVFLVNGLMVTPDAFPAGGKAWLRIRTRASDGALSVVMLSDLASQAAMDMYHKQILVGRVVSIDEKTLVVKPSVPPGSTPISLHLTEKTVFRHNGADADASAFPVDAPVAVQTRSLPSGLLMAAVVSDNAKDLAAEKASHKMTSLSGSAASIDLDKQLLRIIPKTKPGQTIAVAENTRIKVRKFDGTLKDITAGMHVSARLSAQKDTAGHAIAVSLSAYDAPIPMVRQKALPAKKTP